MLRRNTLDRRLFGWLLVLTLLPALGVLLGAAWIWSGALAWIGTLGPWDQVTESGRQVIEAVAPLAADHPELAEAVERHREYLSESALLARRWTYLGERLASQLPIAVLVLSGVLTVVTLWVSRRLARGLARPIEELVEWAERLGRDEPLPEATPDEGRDTVEVQTLRQAFRSAAVELRRARQRAVQAERLRVWGEMARRVAHEMKNPLTPLRFAAERLATAPGSEDALAVVREETARLEELAAQFASLGRPPEGPTGPIDVEELMAGLLATDVPDGIETTLEVAPELPLVEAHYEPLRRAFRNIIRNAVEALQEVDGPKRLRVAASWRGGAGHASGAVGPTSSGEFNGVAAAGANGNGAAGPAMVEVRIADNGPGLPPDLGDRIFEPDCTTKSNGTGLGLALVRQAVSSVGGRVTARNLPDHGAEFVVTLPVARVDRVVAR